MNRLSGKLPKTLANNRAKNISNFDILSNNIFSCNVEDIPTNDPLYMSYFCGSFELEVSSYFWITVSCCIFIILAVVSLFKLNPHAQIWKGLYNLSMQIELWRLSCEDLLNLSVDEMDTVDTSLPRLKSSSSMKSSVSANLYSLFQTKTFLIMMNTLKIWLFVILIILVFIISPVYMSLQKYYSIVSQSYGYFASMMFLHNYPPVIFTGLIIFLLLQSLVVFKRVLNCFIKSTVKAASHYVPMSFSDRFRIITLAIFFHSVNVIVTVAVNSAYVNAILSDKSLTREKLLVIQASVSFFKNVWDGIYIPWCSNRLSKFISISATMQNHFFMSLMNFIIAPCIATTLSNHSCFYYVFNAPSLTITVVKSINECNYYTTCGAGKVCCSQPVSFTTYSSYSSSFQYSYACGTALLVAYIPVTIYTYVTFGFVKPFYKVVLAWGLFLYKRNATSSSSYIISVLTDHVNQIDARISTIELSLHMTVLLTFGMTSSIAGVVITISLLTHIFLLKLMIGRLLTQESSELKTLNTLKSCSKSSKHLMLSQLSIPKSMMSLSPHLASFEFLDSNDSWKGDQHCFYQTIITVSCFWSLLFYDMIADIYGTSAGVIVSLTYGIIVSFIVLFTYAYPKIWINHVLSVGLVKVGSFFHSYIKRQLQVPDQSYT